MIDRLLILLPTPMMLPPITGLSAFPIPEGVALAASSADTALLAGVPGAVCPAFVPAGVAPCIALAWPCADWPNPEVPTPVLGCAVIPSGAHSGPGIWKDCCGFKLPMSWPEGPI